MKRPQNAARPGGHPGSADSEQLSYQSGQTLAEGSGKPTVRLTDYTEVSGCRVRVPVSLLISRRHSPTAIALYALVEMLTGRGLAGRPCHAGRAWMASRLGVKVRALADALRALSVEHHGDGLGQEHEPYLTTRKRGWRLTAQREARRFGKYVQVPAWTLGDRDGLLVSSTAWRLYAALLSKRVDDGTCRLPAAQLAELIGVRRQTIAVLLAELAEAGLVVLAANPGWSAVIMPLTVQTTDAVRATLTEILAGGWSSARPSADPVTTHRGGLLTASMGGPLTASKSHLRKSHLSRNTEETGRTSSGLLDPSRSAARPDDRKNEAALAPQARKLWCRRCDHPQRRREVDAETGFPTGRPCPRCSFDADCWMNVA